MISEADTFSIAMLLYVFVELQCYSAIVVYSIEQYRTHIYCTLTEK